jgi:outer membrane protein assembly factor BamA
MYLKLKKTQLFILLAGIISALSFYTHTAKAQPQSQADSNAVIVESIEYAFLPALGYNSDMGLIGGGIMSRYHLKQDLSPFYSYLIVNAIASTKGLASASVFYDKPHFLGKDLRLISDTYISRFLQNQYYGIGNYAKITDAPDSNPNYYFYKSFSAGAEITLRNPLFIQSETSYIDLYGTVEFAYRTPWDTEPNRLIAVEQPHGFDGFHVASIEAGFIWENRNNEFDPKAGSYAKTGVEMAHHFWGSSTNYLRFESEFRAFTSFFLIREITFANRISFQHTTGSPPYWKLAELGGEHTMRGFPENRFRDDNALFLNTELRTWLFEFPEYNIKLGGTIFADIGRIFPNGSTLSSVFNDLRYVAGFGGNSSFFNENFIFRGDVGFYEEGYGIYFTAGYMF